MIAVSPWLSFGVHCSVMSQLSVSPVRSKTVRLGRYLSDGISTSFRMLIPQRTRGRRFSKKSGGPLVRMFQLMINGFGVVGESSLEPRILPEACVPFHIDLLTDLRDGCT